MISKERWHAIVHLLLLLFVLRGDRRKRLADPLGPTAAAADLVAGAAVALAAAAGPWCHRSPFALHLLIYHLIT